MRHNITELRDAIAGYVLEYSINEIPLHYYETINTTWGIMNTEGYDWDRYNAAAALLYAAVIDGFVHDGQITSQGYNAIAWAEQFLQGHDKTQVIV